MDKIMRKITSQARVGSVVIGGDAPVVIQSMTNTKTADTAATLDQVNRLFEAGCELIRLAVPDHQSVRSFSKIAAKSPVPLIADIHFDANLAHEALENGASKIRINPGNIGGKENLVKLARRAEKEKAAIRIGVNAGSLERNILKKHGKATAGALVESALGYLEVLEQENFTNLVVSLKASDVVTTIKAYRLFAEEKKYPLHLGVTGAGPYERGLIKGAVGIGTLLAEGIGDTLRVSLTAPPEEEVRVARHILQVLGLRHFMPELISCPTCGRCEIDLVSLAGEVEKIIKDYSLPVKVAVMGCAVNGPGEAREADLGVTAGKKQGLLFSYGEVIRTVKFEQLLDALKEELELLKSRQEKAGGK
ncbi:MAG: flavodoxin-dependent (E)-4-hydroxy-3-methylbut-2-enyl-diphosphate synthase [Bacillota bacterium]